MPENDDTSDDADTAGIDDTPDADASATERLDPDPERVRTLREIAEDVRGDSSESEQLANVLYRTSDIFDPDEETTPEDVVRNVKFILEVKERGGLGR